VCFVQHFERFEEVGCDEGSYIWELSVLSVCRRVDGGQEGGGAVRVSDQSRHNRRVAKFEQRGFDGKRW